MGSVRTGQSGSASNEVRISHPPDILIRDRDRYGYNVQVERVCGGCGSEDELNARCIENGVRLAEDHRRKGPPFSPNGTKNRPR